MKFEFIKSFDKLIKDAETRNIRYLIFL